MKRKEPPYRVTRKKLDLAIRRRASLLRADDPRFNLSVLFVTMDSWQFIESAFVEVIDKHYVVFTEHHGQLVQHEDEVEKVVQFKAVKFPATEQKIRVHVGKAAEKRISKLLTTGR